jgi:hypothetical protein
MSDTVILEAQYFPPLEYFSKIILFSNISIEAHEHYQKGSYRNRCHIATSQGIQALSVPLKKGKNTQMPIRDVAIAYDIDWQRQHWQSLKTAYGSAPFWEHYAPMLEPLFSKKHTYLFDLNIDILHFFLKILKIKNNVTVAFTDTYDNENTEGVSRIHREGVIDLRNKISPKQPSSDAIKYAQVFENKHGFLPNLSILDAVLCCGNQTLSTLSQ